MAKEKLEKVTEYEEYKEDYIQELEELSDNDKVVQDSKVQLKFKSVNHSKRAEANEVETDGEIATYANYALEYFGYRCALSGEKLVIFDNPVEREGNARVTTNLSAEHIVALTTGGNDIIPNIVPTVLQYNIQKNGYYILDWWPKAKDINGNSIYSPEKLLKLVNYMLKSLQARNDLGIKKNPREYKKRLLTPNEIDEFLMQEKIAKELLSDTITATTEVEDGKSILTQIPKQEGAIPSLEKQKDKETKITEVMFLTDALGVLGKEEKIPQEIIDRLQNIYKEVEGEIPFEVEIRSYLLESLEQIGVKDNRYTVANDWLRNTDILEKARIISKEELKQFVFTYINDKILNLEEVLKREEISLAIANIPNLIYQKEVVNRVKFWREYRKNSFEFLLQREDNATDRLIDVLIILKKNGLNLTEIKQDITLEDILNGNLEKEKILLELKQKFYDINDIMYIGRRLNNQKNRDLEFFKEELLKADIKLTDEEIKYLTEIETNLQKKDKNTEEVIQIVLLLKQNGIKLTDIKQDKSIGDLLNNNENKEKILIELKKISQYIDEEHPIGARVSTQKMNNILDFKKKLEESGIELTDTEIKHLTTIETQQEKSERVTKELVQVLNILKENGIDLTKIKKNKCTLKYLLEGNLCKQDILMQIQQISDEINEDWDIGGRLTPQRHNKLNEFKNELEKSGIQLTPNELVYLTTIERNQEIKERKTKELVQILIVLKNNGIELTQIKKDSFKLCDMLEDNPRKKEILEEIRKISNKIDGNWNIGNTLLTTRHSKLEELIQNSFELGLELTDEEIKYLTVETKQEESKRKTKELVQMLLIFKQNGIKLTDIKQDKTIEDILNGHMDREKILIELQEISKDANEKYHIGSKISTQKASNLNRLKKELELSGIDLTDEETKFLTTKQTPTDKSERAIKEFVEVIRVLKKYKIDFIGIKQDRNPTRIGDLIEKKWNKEKILMELQEISEEINEEFNIGRRLNNQKNRNIEEFKKALFSSGIELSEKEVSILTEKKDRIDTPRFVQILTVLKKYNLDLRVISRKTTILDVLNETDNKERILSELKEISKEINEEWPIGERVSKQKNKKLEEFKTELEISGIDLTEEELKHLTEKKVNKKIKDTVKQNKGNLSEAIQAGRELGAEILIAEKVIERSASDGR